MTLEFRKSEIERNEGSDGSRQQTLGLRFGGGRGGIGARGRRGHEDGRVETVRGEEETLRGSEGCALCLGSQAADERKTGT